MAGEVRSGGGAMPAPALVRLPAVLATLFPGQGAASRSPRRRSTQLMDELDARWPGMRDRVCDSTPAIRRHMNVFVDGERSQLSTPLRPGADVFIFTAMSGG